MVSRYSIGIRLGVVLWRCLSVVVSVASHLSYKAWCLETNCRENHLGELQVALHKEDQKHVDNLEAVRKVWVRAITNECQRVTVKRNKLHQKITQVRGS